MRRLLVLAVAVAASAAFARHGAARHDRARSRRRRRRRVRRRADRGRRRLDDELVRARRDRRRSGRTPWIEDGEERDRQGDEVLLRPDPERRHDQAQVRPARHRARPSSSRGRRSGPCRRRTPRGSCRSRCTTARPVKKYGYFVQMPVTSSMLTISKKPSPSLGGGRCGAGGRPELGPRPLRRQRQRHAPGGRRAAAGRLHADQRVQARRAVVLPHLGLRPDDRRSPLDSRTSTTATSRSRASPNATLNWGAHGRRRPQVCFWTQRLEHPDGLPARRRHRARSRSRPSGKSATYRLLDHASSRSRSETSEGPPRDTSSSNMPDEWHRRRGR